RYFLFMVKSPLEVYLNRSGEGRAAPAPPSGSLMSRSIRLRPLFNLNYLIGNQAMGFAMDRICSLFIWRFDQAKDLAALLVKPVAQVLDAVLLLCPQVGFMGLGNRIRGQSFDMSVRIHIQWHEISPH